MIGQTVSHAELTLNPSHTKRGIFLPTLPKRRAGDEFAGGCTR